MRRNASLLIRVTGEADLPGQIENSSDGERVWAIRAPVPSKSLPPAFALASQFVLDSPFLVQKALADAPARRQPLITPLMALDGAASPQLFTSFSLEQGEVLDDTGKPLRWLLPENVLAGYSKPRPTPFLQLVEPDPRLERALAGLAPVRGARHYRGLVENYARRYDLNVNLVMAIIHCESDFAPTLVSNKSAMGLMQLLPSTASGEVHQFLYGRRGQLTFAELSQPDINIRYGTAYLHILHSRYFNNIRDSHVREACVVASYNMGPNGFLRLYGPTPEAAVERINGMSREQFNADLPRRLPARETRYYVEKVRRMKAYYADGGQ